MPDLSDLPILPEVDDADRVVGLVARLPRDSVVRRMVMHVVQGRPVDSLQPLVSSLARPGITHWRERQAAAWALGRTVLSTEDRIDVVNHLLDTLEGVHSEPWSGRFARGALVTLAASFGLIFLFSLPDGPPRVRDGRDLLAILTMFNLFASFATFPLTFWHAKQADIRVRAEAARSLGRIGSVGAVGTLAAALQDGNEPVRNAAARSLHQLLPLVTAEHYGTFGTVAIESLGKALFHPDGQLVFKTLTALEKVGTSAAIPYVQRAAQRGRTQRVQEAADRVLRVLQERQRRETQRDQLLRPTDGLHDHSVLLRAPTANPSDDPAILLQPAGDGG